MPSRTLSPPAPTAKDEILVDMGEDHITHMAALSCENCAGHYGRVNDYIQAVLTVNQLFQFAESRTGQRILRIPTGLCA